MESIKKKGLSLLEVILALAILGLLLSICSLTLHWACNVYDRVKSKGITGNEAYKSIAWLISDLRETSTASVYLDKEPSNELNSISFLSGVEQNIDMEYTVVIPLTKWKNFALYYLWPDPKNSDRNLLIRKTLYDPVTYPYAFKKFIPEPMKSSDVLSLCDGNLAITPENRIIARNISALELLDMDLQKSSCNLRVKTIEKTRTGIDAESVYTTLVIMRNTIGQPVR